MAAIVPNRFLILLIILFDNWCLGTYAQQESSLCSNDTAVCTKIQNCRIKFKRGLTICDYRNNETFICCPWTQRVNAQPVRGLQKRPSNRQFRFRNFKSSFVNAQPIRRLQKRPSNRQFRFRNFKSSFERRADRACKIIEQGLNDKRFEIQTRILGGRPTSYVEYPHMARIMFDNPELRCGGSLIDKRFVLTAAHCVDGNEVNPIKVVLGVTDFDDPTQTETRQDINIKKIHVHPNYDVFGLYNDIALIELDGDAKFNQNVYPTCLHTDQTELSSGTDLVVTGWGLIENQKPSEILLAANLNYISLQSCVKKYANRYRNFLNRGIVDTQLCAYSPDSDTCDGDSGGPLHIVHDQNTNNYRVVGIVSIGPKCGSSLPGVYTRVSKYLDFIEGIVWPVGLSHCKLPFHTGSDYNCVTSFCPFALPATR